MDSRLRSERGFSIDTNKARPHSLGSHELQKLEQSGGGGGGKLNGDTEHKEVDKRQARDVLVNKITEAAGKEKRLSNGIRVSPVSTKGEVTTTQSTTKVTPPTTAASTPPLTQSPKRGTKGGGGGEEKSKEDQQQTSLRDTPVSDSSSDTIPILRPESSTSSGGPFSPTDEFQFMAGSEGEPLIQQGGGKSKEKSSSSKDQQSSRSVGKGHPSTSSEELYDKLEPYEQLSMSESESGSSRTTPAPITPTPSNPGLTLTASKDNGSCWSDDSGEYDHLPPALDSLPEKGQIHLDQLLGVSAYRRITSQPALSTPASARESPVDRSPSNIIQEETSEEEEEEDEDDELGNLFEAGKSPTNLDAEEGSQGVKGQIEGGSGVILRKRNKHLDPFADILGSPHAAARLRWSQELNPLYDYIKGYKISESVKLYDSPSKLLKSTNASDLQRKSTDGGELGGGRAPAPSIIVEEESEPSSREQTCSPSESQGEGEDEPRCELKIPHETSTLPRTRKPHLYEEISFADRSPEEERPASEMGMVEKLKLASKLKNRSLYEKEAQKGVLSHLIGRSDTSPIQHRKKIMEKAGVSPRIGKRELLQQRRSRTINSLDDSATEKRKQRSMRAGDSLKVCLSVCTVRVPCLK